MLPTGGLILSTFHVLCDWTTLVHLHKNRPHNTIYVPKMRNAPGCGSITAFSFPHTQGRGGG